MFGRIRIQTIFDPFSVRSSTNSNGNIFSIHHTFKEGIMPLAFVSDYHLFDGFFFYLLSVSALF